VCFLLPATLFLSIANFIGMDFKLYDEAGWQKLTTEKLSKIRERGIAALGKPQTFQQPHFNLDLAETLLFLSSVVYLREETEVRKAVTYLSQIRNNINKQEQVEVCDLENVFQALENADEGVRKVVNDWMCKWHSPISYKH
ncbi:15010_t:CDS:2, partial [Dentiscutata heterogama]